jgi:cbb3-type cytochrome oxidase maturation protein
MSVMFLLIGCSLFIALAFLGMFLWSVNSGQYEDTFTPSVRMLFDQEEKEPPAKPPTVE